MENNKINTNGTREEINSEMFEKLAKDYSEGNEDLRKLLIYCFENDIKTTACCSGHNGQKRPYVQFELNDKNMGSILKMLKHISLDDTVNNLTYIKRPGVTSAFSVSMQKDKYNEGFEKILNILQTDKEIDISEIDETRRLMINSARNHSISNSYLELQEEKDSVAIAVGEEYFSVLPIEEEAKTWLENTQMIEYQKGNLNINDTLKKLESKTKNIRSISEHPYDRDKINDFWQDKKKLRTIEVNPLATMERQSEYGERNVIIVNALLGTDIESLANDISQLNQYGQACIVKFNSVVIDSRDYNGSEEIIQAYKKLYNRCRQQQTEPKTKKENNEMLSMLQEKVVTDDIEYMQNVNNNGISNTKLKEESLEEIK